LNSSVGLSPPAINSTIADAEIRTMRPLQRIAQGREQREVDIVEDAGHEMPVRLTSNREGIVRVAQWARNPRQYQIVTRKRRAVELIDRPMLREPASLLSGCITALRRVPRGP
jgi:hypothetical protein